MPSVAASSATTKTLLRRQLRVRYPAGRGRVVLRTELDWDRDLEPIRVSTDGETSTFALEARKPFLYFKPCLRTPDGEVLWSVGPNMLVLMTTRGTRDVFPYFEGSVAGSFSEVLELDSTILGRKHLLRIYLPPGYRENTLRRHPVLYMQDGKNLFFPEEAFGGRAWQVDETLHLLDGMNAVDRVIVVGIYSGDRMGEYTKPGYEAYARSVVEELKPSVRVRVCGLHAAVLEDLRKLVPLAPLHQPHNLAAIEAVFERLPGGPAGGLLRHELPSRAAAGRRACAAAVGDPPLGRAALRVPWPVLRVHRVRAARGGAGDRPGARDRRPPGKRRERLRPRCWQKRGQQPLLHRPRRPLHGYEARGP